MLTVRRASRCLRRAAEPAEIVQETNKIQIKIRDALITVLSVLSGPVVSYGDAAPQLTNRTVSVFLFTQGMERFVTGLAKKVLIANPLSTVADAAFALQPKVFASGK